MAISTVVKNDIEGSIVLSDGTGSPVTLTVDVCRGDFSGGPFREVLNETVVIERRGQFKGLAHGPRIYPTFTFTAHMTEFTNASVGVLSDFLLRQGAYASNISTLGANARKYTLDIALTWEGTDLGDDADSTLTMTDCEIVIDSLSEASEGNSFSISGTCYGAVTGLAASEVS